jgi:hypothetical protein
MNAWQAGMIVARRRIACRSVVGALTGAALCVLGSAWLERGRPALLARADVLRGAAFGVVLPLLAYFLVARVVRTGPIGSAVQSLGRAGYNRRTAVVSVVFTVEALAAVAGACLAALGAWAATRGVSRDFAAVLLVGGAGGASYAALFCWGASLGSKGGGSLAMLGLDWLLGVSSSGWAMPWPRAHLRCLLGGDAVMGLPSSDSAWVLILLIVMATAWTAARTPP